MYNFFIYLLLELIRTKRKYLLSENYSPICDFANSQPSLNTSFKVCSILLTCSSKFLILLASTKAIFHFIDLQLFVSKSVIHLFRREQFFRFRHFTVLLFAFKGSIQDSPSRNKETATSETRWEIKELCSYTTNLVTCKM